MKNQTPEEKLATWAAETAMKAAAAWCLQHQIVPNEAQVDQIVEALRAVTADALHQAITEARECRDAGMSGFAAPTATLTIANAAIEATKKVFVN